MNVRRHDQKLAIELWVEGKQQLPPLKNIKGGSGRKDSAELILQHNGYVEVIQLLYEKMSIEKNWKEKANEYVYTIMLVVICIVVFTAVVIYQNVYGVNVYDVVFGGGKK